jgi:hypothetical protein
VSAVRVAGARGRWAAVAAIEGIVVIHLVLTPMHLAEMPYVGVLFTVGNALLLVALALLVSRRHQAAGWLLGAAVCAGELVAYVLSRTVGLPMHYHGTWLAEREDYLGLVSLACEVVFLAVAASRLGAALRGRLPVARAAIVARWPSGIRRSSRTSPAS